MKAVLFDLDGLVLKNDGRLFSERYAEEYNVPLESVREFFMNDLKPCSLGKADLKDSIAPYLIKWGWEASVDDFLDYWFRSGVSRDEDVLAIVSELRARGIKCYLATQQEKYRMTYLERNLGLKEHFDGTFVTYAIGHEKSTPEFYSHVLSELDSVPEQVLFFDDSQKKIDAALSVGINAHLYEGIASLRAHISALLS